MIEWSPWRPLPRLPSLSSSVLREILDGGQAFRWTCQQIDRSSVWTGIWSQRIARLRLAESGLLEASAPDGDTDALADLQRYLGCDTNWSDLADALPWRSDTHLKRCVDTFTGLRLLKQPFPETILTFLCSATKQIPQIKILCANLAAALGVEFAPGARALPTWEALAASSEAELRALGLGFRARNIKRSADIIAASPGLLDEIERAPYLEAKQRLLELPGVGEKIADCALLFGAGQLEAFPVDTWILKTLAARYGLAGWSLTQLAHFGRIHFGQSAGYAQQFLFAWERAQRGQATLST